MNLNRLLFRPILPSDFEVIKALHDDFFPVKYSEEFYRNTCCGVGLGGGKLYSCIATTESGSIVGFILAQIFDYPSQCEDKCLFANESTISKICYVITLGVIEQARQTGLGSILLQYCIQYAKSVPECGAVYLHVLHSNSSALRFYQKNNFLELRFLKDFYFFEEANHSAYLYIQYVNSGVMPQPRSTSSWLSASYWFEAGFNFLSSFMSYFPRSDNLFAFLPHPTGIAGLGAVLNVAPPGLGFLSVSTHYSESTSTISNTNSPAGGSGGGGGGSSHIGTSTDGAEVDQC